MRIKGRALILLLSVVIAFSWSRIESSRRDAEIRALAAQPACALALEYWTWRDAFERTLPEGTTVLEGDVVRRFIAGSQRYRDAIERHDGASGTALRTLYLMVQFDGDPDEETLADGEVPLRDFLRACPDEATALFNEVERP